MEYNGICYVLMLHVIYAILSQIPAVWSDVVCDLDTSFPSFSDLT
jgi:hypothetical protein